MSTNLYRLAYRNETGIIYDWFYLKGSNWRYYSHYTREWQAFSKSGISRTFKERAGNIMTYPVKNIIEK